MNPVDGTVLQVFSGPVTNVIDTAVFPPPNERFVAAIYRDNNLRVWNATTGAVVYHIPFGRGVAPWYLAGWAIRSDHVPK